MDGRSSKRRRGNITRQTAQIGAPTEADIPGARNAVLPSSASASIRILPPENTPTLSYLCMRQFASNVHALVQDDHGRSQEILRYLKLLPDELSSKMFNLFQTHNPNVLTSQLMVSCFLRGTTISLTGDLPGLRKETILTIPGRSASTLSELTLSGLADYGDTVFASVISKLTHLRVLVLRRCTKVGEKTVTAAAENCPNLLTVNLSYTSVAPLALLPLLLAVEKIEVLKLAGLPSWTDATCAKLLSALPINFQLQSLRTIKLRQNALSDVSLHAWLGICPNIRRIDISFTDIKRLPNNFGPTSVQAIEKLSLTSTKINNSDLVALVSELSGLKTLSIGAMGGGQISMPSLTLDDAALQLVTDCLERCANIEVVNLVGNYKLGRTGGRLSALQDFIKRVGRRCKRLNLAGIVSLRSSDLSGLMPEGPNDKVSALEDLNLNNTAISDQASPFISSCLSLTTLHLQGTKCTTTGIFPIIDACNNLREIDLTSVRGIPVRDRRRFFEIWEEERSQETH